MQFSLSLRKITPRKYLIESLFLLFSNFLLSSSLNISIKKNFIFRRIHQQFCWLEKRLNSQLAMFATYFNECRCSGLYLVLYKKFKECWQIKHATYQHCYELLQNWVLAWVLALLGVLVSIIAPTTAIKWKSFMYIYVVYNL